MTPVEAVLQYLSELFEGTRQPPEGICLTETEPMARAAQLRQQIAALGLAEFVRRCAAQDGQSFEASMLDGLTPDALLAAMQTPQRPEPPEEAQEDDAPPQIDEPDGPRSACEVLLDCCCLEEPLFRYLVDVLRRGADDEFQKLALVTTRKAFTAADFLHWFAGKHERADERERGCAVLLDACLDRLAAEGRTELIAGLLCGDRTVFERFRAEAPELRQVPAATYEWFAENYLDRYYPTRFLLKFNGVRFPNAESEA